MDISIVTPLYNGMPYIRQCIGSIRAQASPEEYSIEHVVQDGGSTDQSVQWLRDNENALNASGYTLTHQSESDNGMYDAINKGWERSTGEILSWLNHDEQYMPGTLNKVRQCFIRYPEIDVVWGNFICVDTVGNAVAHRKEPPARRGYMLYGTCYMASCTLFYRRHLWDDGILRLDDSYRLSADRELLIRLLEQKIKARHLSAYLSLFTVSKENLSARYKHLVVEEDERIDQQHGIQPGKIKKIFFKCSRYLEKALRGAYFRKSLTYDYCVDELGGLEKRTQGNVGHKLNFKMDECDV